MEDSACLAAWNSSLSSLEPLELNLNMVSDHLIVVSTYMITWTTSLPPSDLGFADTERSLLLVLRRQSLWPVDSLPCGRQIRTLPSNCNARCRNIRYSVIILPSFCSGMQNMLNSPGHLLHYFVLPIHCGRLLGRLEGLGKHAVPEIQQ